MPLTRRRVAPALLATALGLAASAGAAPARADTAACIAASEQGLALRQQGKLREALAQLAVCADAACPAEVVQECARRIDEVKAALPTLILEAKDGAGNDRSNVKVSMDGVHLTDTLDGRPFALDPGEHTFVFEAPGEVAVERKLVLREGDKDRREGVMIGTPPPVAPPALPPSATPSSWTGRRTLALVSAGLGLVGVGLGVGWGAYAISSQNREKSDCSKLACLNPAQATEDYNTARQDATASTVGVVVGAALLTAGAVLWLTQPSAHEAPAAAGSLGVVPSVTGLAGHGGGSLVLVGDF